MANQFRTRARAVVALAALALLLAAAAPAVRELEARVEALEAWMGDSVVVVDANGQRIGFATDSGVFFEEPGVPVLRRRR